MRDLLPIAVTMVAAKLALLLPIIVVVWLASR
jgi:hypothetical protein